jgi:hypothetical protein
MLDNDVEICWDSSLKFGERVENRQQPIERLQVVSLQCEQEVRLLSFNQVQ